MFIGHYALAFGAKRYAPSVSLGTLFLACQFADLLWPTLVVLGIEHVEVDPGNTAVTPLNFVSYPYSHSLVMLVMWSALTRARDRIGSLGLWTLIAFLTAIYVAAIFGPPPPNSAAVAMAGHLSWLFVAWAYWVDRHRK
jgi:hypothetical protein